MLRQVDCNRTDLLKILKNNYSALQEVDSSAEELKLATLEGDVMTFSDLYFETFGPCEDDESRIMGYVKYSSILHSAHKEARKGLAERV